VPSSQVLGEPDAPADPEFSRLVTGGKEGKVKVRQIRLLQREIREGSDLISGLAGYELVGFDGGSSTLS
jgi:hypothetical protein